MKEQTMSIGQAYSNLLTPQEQKALQASCDILIDSIFDEINNAKTLEDIANMTIGDYLPERYLSKYTPLFLRKFAVCIITVAWKLAQPQHIPLSSLAEELAAWTIIERAKVALEEAEDDTYEAFETFIDDYFEDTDFEYLYDDAYDGIDETQLSAIMGISSFAFRDWFQPFSDEPSRTPHPYTHEDDVSKI
jgi:hypothetical protein